MAGLGGCDATDTRDGVQVIPGYMDKDQALGTIKQVRPLESALATGDADKILNLIGWLFGNASGIVLGPSSGPTAALDSDSSADLSAAAGSATCDAAGCVFMRYLHGEPNGGSSTVDGTISVAAVDAGTRTITVDLVSENGGTVAGPTQLDAVLTLSSDLINGSLHRVFEIPSLDDDFVEFRDIFCPGSEPTSGSLYARWVTDQFGGYEGTVTFP